MGFSPRSTSPMNLPLRRERWPRRCWLRPRSLRRLRRRSPRVSGLELVLTLAVNKQEGHLPYLSQSVYPAKGTTVGGRTDDPRRERTRNASARHRARAGAWQRQRGLPRAGNLADGVLSLAHPAGTLRRRGGPSAATARRSRSAGGDPAGGGTAGAQP